MRQHYWHTQARIAGLFDHGGLPTNTPLIHKVEDGTLIIVACKSTIAREADMLFNHKNQQVNKQTNIAGDLNVQGDLVGGNKHEHHYHLPVPPEPEKPVIDLDRLPQPSTALQGRQAELEKLDKAFDDSNVIAAAIVAPGGVGKSALTEEWLQRMAARQYGGALRVFAWSFYSQGSHTTATSSLPFFQEALPFFGLEGELPKDEAEKGRALAECLKRRPFVLILDGLEPLQHPLHFLDGELKDTALKSLFSALHRMRAENSLVLFSSRQKLYEFYNWRPERYCQLDLHTLDNATGAAVLRHLGVEGKAEELQTASGKLGGHALALVLLGRMLVKHHQRDIRRMDKLPDLFAEEKDGGHALRVMQWYDNYWSENAPERAFLYLLGLFDRPMGDPERKVLFEKAEIAKPLAALNEDEFHALERNLEELGLLLPGPRIRVEWDCHPVVRTFFGRTFKKTAYFSNIAIIYCFCFIRRYRMNIILVQRNLLSHCIDPCFMVVYVMSTEKLGTYFVIEYGEKRLIIVFMYLDYMLKI